VHELHVPQFLVGNIGICLVQQNCMHRAFVSRSVSIASSPCIQRTVSCQSNHCFALPISCELGNDPRLGPDRLAPTLLTHFCYDGKDPGSNASLASRCFSPLKDVCAMPYDERAERWARGYYGKHLLVRAHRWNEDLILSF
jgi:hypothetical protein